MIPLKYLHVFLYDRNIIGFFLGNLRLSSAIFGNFRKMFGNDCLAFGHSKRNSISTRTHVLSSIYLFFIITVARKISPRFWLKFLKDIIVITSTGVTSNNPDVA